MTQPAVAAVIALLACVCGCSRDAGLRCENQARYGGAVEVAPIIVPDDLDPPSEAEALRVPTIDRSAVAGAGAGAASCTEAPPDFFQEGLPG